MKIVRVPENDHLNKQLIAEGDEHAIALLRNFLASRGVNVEGTLAMDVGEGGVIVVYDPPPLLSLALRRIRRFSLRAMTQKDVVYQNRLARLRKLRGGIKVRKWSDEHQQMVTEEHTDKGIIVTP